MKIDTVKDSLVDVAKAAGKATPDQLLKAYASLTHQMHASDAEHAAVVREHRDVLAGVMVEQMNQAAALAASRTTTIDCPYCDGNGHREGTDCKVCNLRGSVRVVIVGPAPARKPPKHHGGRRRLIEDFGTKKQKAQEREDFLTRTGYEG